MLVLTRRLGETIHIGPDITVTVLDIDRGKIRLGIVAPKDVPIYRAELLPKVEAERIAIIENVAEQMKEAADEQG